MADGIFKIKHHGMTLKVRRMGRDELLTEKTLHLLDGVGMTNEELRHCGAFVNCTSCIGEPVSDFKEDRLFVEIVSPWYK